MFTKNCYAIICFILCFQISFSQNIKLTGKVTDSLNTPLSNANIIAEPKEGTELKFAIANDDGSYKLTLKKDRLYQVTISYLGYIPESFDLKSNVDTAKSFVLKENLEQLNEITLNYTPPVLIKEDTITYRTNVFKTGEERKLRDVLKKLPAVEVDRKGNVTVMGKKVTKVLVENKEFFTGDSKLAVNNIPADAVDQVEILDNYNDVSFLKGLSDSEEMAMNIKLNEDKKKFAFGDVEAGAGIEDRYLLHPSLFYYSPKTSLNIIGDFNNTGEKSFTLKEYLNFEGGITKLLSNSQSYYSALDNDFTQFLNNEDFISNFNQFGAFNITQAINPKVDFSSYGIWADSNNKALKQSLNNYISIGSLLENRVINEEEKNSFGIGKIALEIEPNKDTDITFSTYLKGLNSNSTQNILTIIEEEDNINTNIDNSNFSINQNVEWHKRINKKHTASFVTNYNYKEADPSTRWLTDKLILQNFVPLVEQETYSIIKNKKSSLHEINPVLKHYWVLNNYNHIYTTIGSQLLFSNYDTFEYQLLDDNSINDFSTDGFGNRISLNFNDLFIGLHYKFKIGSTTFKPGIFYHNYFWEIDQNNQNLKNHRVLLLPELTTNFKSTYLKNRITIKYGLKSRFPRTSQLANRFTILNFNNVYQGNQDLKNELYHSASFNINRFSTYKNIFYDFSIIYETKKDNFKNKISIEETEYLSSPILSDFKDSNWRFIGNFRKGIGKLTYSTRIIIDLINYDQPINNNLIPNTANSFLFNIGLHSKFKNFPNFNIDYTSSFYKYKALTNSMFKTDGFSVYLEYDFFKDFIFKADYSFKSYENKTLSSLSTFDITNASLFYQKEDNPWGFEISTSNLFNVGFKQNSSFSDIFVSDQKTFILPRIFLFKIFYKL